MLPEVENAGAPAPEPAAPPFTGEDEAWAQVVAAWDDEARHRAYLDRFADLEGLAVAGRRYREVLQARPEDPLALRFRDEVLRRATIHGLALAPRAPAPARGRTLARVAAVAVLAGLAAAGLLFARDLAGLLGARP